MKLTNERFVMYEFSEPFDLNRSFRAARCKPPTKKNYLSDSILY